MRSDSFRPTCFSVSTTCRTTRTAGATPKVITRAERATTRRISKRVNPGFFVALELLPELF
jgi:hypothetical protein